MSPDKFPPFPESPVCCAATPREELRRQIMSSLVPKNEREHWAARHIEELERELEESHNVVMATRQASIEGFNRLRVQLGVDEKDPRPVVDLVKKLQDELTQLRKRMDAADKLADVLEEFAGIGREYYDMDMGSNGSLILEASDKALAAYRATAPVSGK